MAEIQLPSGDALIVDSLDIDAPSQVNKSGWTGTRRGLSLPGAEVWYAKVTIADLATEIETRPWRAFLLSLRGRANWFRLPLLCQLHAGDRPTVRAGATAGYSLPLAGLAPSATVLTAGEFLTVQLPSGKHRTVCLAAPLNSNGQGQGTAVFEQLLREAPATGVVVETRQPFIPMALTDSMSGLSYSQGIAGRSFDLEEYR